MPRDASGNYTLPPGGNPVVPGTVIEADWANPTLADVAAALTDSLSRSGSGGMLTAFKTADGTMLAPGASWVNEPTSGWFRNALNDFWFSVGNENIFRVTKTGIELAAGKTPVNITKFTNVQDAQPAGMVKGEQWWESDTGGFYMRYVNPDATVTLVALGQTGGDFVPMAMRGAANGVAPLDSGSKVPVGNIGGIGVANGIAGLDAAGKVPAANLPVEGLIPPGTIFDYGATTVPAGWLNCDGAAVSRTTYAALFAAIGIEWGAGDGATTFNLPDLRGRMTIGHGTGTLALSGDAAGVDPGANQFIVPSNPTTWITGMSVRYDEVNGNVPPLVSGTTYFVIRSSATRIQLAATLANAIAGTAINLTGVGALITWTLTQTLTNRVLGVRGGEQSHVLLATEVPPLTTDSQGAHVHDAGAAFNTATGTDQNVRDTTVGTIDTGSAGAHTHTVNATGGVAHNVMPPFGVVRKMIKT